MFEIEGNISQWDDCEASLALFKSLTGSAMGVILSIPPQLSREGDYQALRNHLSASFGTTTTPKAALVALHSRTQQERESIHTFAMEISTLAQRAFPHDPWEAQQQAVGVFCAGLRDTTLAQSLCINMHQFATLADAERSALQG